MTRRKPLWSCLLTRQTIASQQLRKSRTWDETDICLGQGWGVVYSCNLNLETGDSRNICIILLLYIFVRRPGFTENTRGTTKLLLPSFAWMVMATDSDTYEIGFESTASAAASSNHQTIQMRGDRLFINQEGMVPDAATAPQGTKRLVSGESEADAHWVRPRILEGFFNCPGFLKSMIW